MAMPPPSSGGSVPADAAQLIRAWRRHVALTQEGLAEALSVAFSTVSRRETGHVLPSKLAWRALQQLAAERGRPFCPRASGQAGRSADRGTARTAGGRLNRHAASA